MVDYGLSLGYYTVEPTMIMMVVVVVLVSRMLIEAFCFRVS